MSGILGAITGAAENASPAGAIVGGIGGILNFVGRFFTDKTQVEKDNFTLALTDLVNRSNEAAAQVAVDEAEARSPDRINHWRGALGWVCVLAIGWNYLFFPLFQYGHAVAVSHGWAGALPALPKIDDAPLMQIMLLMLGSHAVPVVSNAISNYAASKKSGT